MSPTTPSDPGQIHSSRRLRVLVVAESANPVLTSVSLIGWSFSRALSEVADVHLTAEIRNETDIRKAGLGSMQFTPIHNRFWQGMAWRIAKVLRGGTSLGWSTYSALATLAYPAFERKVWREFGSRIQAGEFDVVHRIVPNAPVTPSLLATRCARVGARFVWGPINGGVPWPKEFAHLQRAEREWLGRFRNIHRAMPGFHSTRRDATALLIGARIAWNEMPSQYHSKCVFIPENAIDEAKFPRTPPRAFIEPLRVAFVGRLVPLKGVDMLLEASAELARAGRLRLDIIGDGPEMPRLKQLASELGITASVEFPGWVKHDQLGARLTQSHVFGFPSVREFGGGVVLEAMALGLVPVVLDYGGPAELVPPGSGWVIPMGSRESIIRGLTENFAACLSEPRRITEAAVRAQNHVFDHFTWQAKARQVMEVYRWMLKQRMDKPNWGIPFGFPIPAESLQTPLSMEQP